MKSTEAEFIDEWRVALNAYLRLAFTEGTSFWGRFARGPLLFTKIEQWSLLNPLSPTSTLDKCLENSSCQVREWMRPPSGVSKYLMTFRQLQRGSVSGSANERTTAVH
jgi:hypothetical protein